MGENLYHGPTVEEAAYRVGHDFPGKVPALARLLALPSVSQAEAEQWLSAFQPWRALVAAHLWASLSAKTY